MKRPACLFLLAEPCTIALRTAGCFVRHPDIRMRTRGAGLESKEEMQ